MGKLKRISEGKRTQAGTGGGHFRRIDTGEIITYNPDPVRSLPRVDKITGGGRTASPSLPTVSGTKGTQTDESRADAIREALVRLDAIEQTRAAAPRLTAEGLEREALEEIGREFGLDAQQTRTAYTARKALEEDLDRITNPRRKAGRAERGGKIEGAYSFGKSVEGAVVKGLEQVARFGGDTFALAEDIALAPFELLSGNDLGTFSDKGPLNRWAADIRKEQEAIEAHYAPNATRGGKAAQIFEDLGASTVAALPQAVLALLTGGGSAAAQTTAGLTGTAAQAVSPGVAATVQGAVRSMAKNPQYWTSFAQVVGSSYEDALDDMIELEAQKEMTAALIGETYEPPENQNAMRAKAALYAIGNGLMNAAVEIGGGIQTLPDQLRGGQSAWKSWVEAMVDEGKEEVVQGVIERALQNPMYGAGNPLFSTTDERAIFNPATAAQEFAGGAVVGGVLGGGQIGATRGINAAARRAAEEQAPRQAQGPQSTQAAPAGTQNADPEGAAVNENGLSAYTERERVNLASGKKNRIVSTFQEAVDFVRNALANRQSTDRAYLGKVPDETARRVLDDTGVDIAGYNAVIPSDAVRHIFKNHGDSKAENARGQVAITPETAARIPEVLSDPDRVMLSPQTDGRGLPTLLFEKDLGDYYVTAQAVADGSHSIQTDTLYIRKKKNSQDAVIDAGQQTGPEDNVQNVPPQSSSGLNVSQAEGEVNMAESPSGDTKSGVTVRDGVTTTPERDSADLTTPEARLAGQTPVPSSDASGPVEGTRPLNSDSTIAPGAENVNTQGRTRLRPAPINYDMAEEGARVVRVLKERYGSSPTLEDIRNFDWSRGSEFYPKVAEAIRAGFVKAGKKKGGLYVVRETRPQTQAAENTDQQPVTAEMDGPIDRAADGGVQSEQETEERTVNSYGRQGAAEGGRVSDGDLGRLSGTGAGEQTGGVGTGAERGRGPTDTFRAARERQNSVHDLRGGPVSSRDLGLRRGTDAKTLQVIPESAWDDGLRATADRVREETGLDTVFVTGGIQIGTPDGARLVRGAYTGDRIIVQADNIRVTPDQIADHEIFHDRAAQTPGLILELETRIREQYGAEELDRVVDRYIQKLRGVIDVTENTGEDGTQAEAWAILEEIFADAYAGINAFSAHAEQFNETVEQTMTERGVGRGSQNAAATDRTTGPPAEGRYSFGGENAQRADLEALDRAQDMERRGVAMENIFRETGWYTGADGKWRFEIDDSGMEYDPAGDLQGAVSRQWAMEDLEAAKEDLFGSITQEQADMVRAYNRAKIARDTAEQQRLYDELTSAEFGFLFETYADALERATAAKNNPQGGTLADYINHPELFANYPQLRQASLQFTDLPDGTRGRYNTESHTITLDNSLRGAPEDTLVHEIQHAIQSAEGFSGGSSPEYWARREFETGDLVTNRLQQEYDQILNGLGREDQNKYIRYTELERELERLFLSDPNTEAGRRYDRLEAEQDAIYEELYPNAWFRQLLDLSRRMEDTAGEYRRMYENTAGEIEARDVTARRQLTPEQRRRTMPNTGDENTVFAESGDSYSMQEPDAAAQDEAERLLFQGVDADTIRELTGLERTEDGDWRFAVDTAPAAAYDGGRTIDQQGGLDDGQNEYDAQGVLGETARREAERAESFAGTSGADATETRRTGRQAHDGRADTGTHPRWARGHLIDQPSPAAGIAAENAGRYGADAFVVDDAAIKERNPNAWALTSGGKVYISNRIPADLADVVGFHEAVHAAKQNESPNYRAFIENTLGYISKESAETTWILDLLSSTRFGGKAFTELSDREVQTALDELNALVWGFHKADPENARAQFADMFQDYDAYIADLDAAMESGAEPEIPGLSLPTLDDEDIRYSVDEDTAAEPSDNPLPSPDQSGRSDLHRPRGMSDEQYNRLNEQWKSRPAAQRAEPGAVPEGFDSIDDYTVALEAAAEERMRNRSREEFEGSDALKSLGIRIANSVGLYGNTQQLIENDRAAKSVRKEIKRAERRLQATDAEKNFASGVAAGIYGEADIPPSMDADTVMELADYYWAEKAVQNDLIREQRTKINRNLDERVRRLMDGVDDTKTKVPAAVIMRNRTPERNMRRIFGNAKGDEINDYLFRPVQDNEAERIRFINRMHSEVRTFKDRNGKDRKLDREERALVQLVIEGRAAEDAVNAMERSRDIQNAAENIKNARKLAGKDDLAKRRQAEIDASVDEAREFNLGTDERRLAIQYSRWLETQERLTKADTTIIDNAVEKYRELFNQLYDAANDFLVAHGYEPIGFIRGYAPHLQSQETQERFNSALERMGINREIGKLPTSIAGRTKNFKPNMPWNGFFKNRNSQGEFLDPDIAEGFEKYVDSMSDVLYHTDDIMRTRAFVRYFRRTYAPEEIRNQLEQADALRYAQTDQQASFLRDKGKLSYTSAPTYEDVHQAMEQYVEDQYQAIENLTLYGDLAVFLDDYANNLANKQLFEDRAMEKSFGRTSLNAISRVHRAFARAQVSANLSSALNQGGQLPIILAENGTRNVAQALIELRSKDLKSWAAGSDFLTEKKGINYIVTSWKDRAITGAFKPLEIVDGIVSTLAVRSRYLKEVRAGKSAAEAMRLADRFGREVMASRAKGSVPLAFRSKDFLNQMVHMFQLEALNNWEHVIQDLGNRDFREMARAKGKRAAAGSLAAVLVKIILGAFLLNRIDEELYGGTPAPFDVLGLAGNLFAGGLGLTQMDLLRTLVDNVWERLTGERLFDTDPELNEFDAAAGWDDFVWNGLNEIPFASNVAALAGMGDRTLPMPDLSNLADLPGTIAEDGLFSWEVARQLAGLAGDVLPGGRQIEKSIQGGEALLRGGYYRGSGENRRLQFPVEQDFWSIVRGILFGQSALDESRDFYASGQTGLSANQTKAYEQIVDMGADPETVYQAIQGWRAAENDEALNSYGRGVAKRDAITEADLTDEQKLALYRGLSDADSSTPDHFRAMMDTGLSWEEVMEAYDQYQFLNSDEDTPEAERLSASEKATEFASWVERQNYTEDQAETVKEALRYWQMIPAEASEKILLAQEYGVSDSSRKAAAEEIDRLKGDGNSVTQDMAAEALENMPGLDNRERAILWQLQNKSWKWNKNPFDKRVGREVYDRMHEEDEA